MYGRSKESTTFSCLSGQLECYLRLEGDEGILESPNYPSPYPAEQDCKYDIIRTSSSVCGVRLYGKIITIVLPYRFNIVTFYSLDSFVKINAINS